jgi:hypothetical protein
MFEPHNSPEWLKDILQGSGLSFMWAAVGRLMFHARQVQQGRRRLFSKSLMLELPIALGMGMVGAGVAELWGFQGHVRDAVLVSAGFVGPRAIEQTIERLLKLTGRDGK